MKTIGIDCRFASGNSGLGRYTREIVSGLVQKADDVRFVLFVRSLNEDWLKKLPSAPRCRLQVADIPHYSLAEQTRFPLIIWRSGIDLLFSMHFNVPLLCPVPFVATIHDLILHRYPSKSLPKQVSYRMQMAFTVRKAKALCTVSSFTALEIGGAYGSRVFAKCTVTGEGVHSSFSQSTSDRSEIILKKYGLHKPYFVYVGSSKEHKNVSCLLQSFADLGDPCMQLVLIVGSGDLPSPLPDNAICLRSVSEDDLPALYAAADCFVTASLYEGYGLPIAEALSCGCPVVAADLTAIPEVASGAAMLIEPTASAFTAAMRTPPKRPVCYSRPQWNDACAITSRVLLRSIDPESGDG